jgi:Peptidase family M1 domain
VDVVTEVLALAAEIARFTLVFLMFLSASALGQQEQVPASTNKSIQPQNTHNAERLYLNLRSVGLDPAKVFRVREASFDHDQIHITLEDGTIAFTEDVNERVTGAFFEGEGEILIVPPDQAERASMSLFTRAAVLEEKFGSAYFRFNDDTYAGLQPSLRPAEDGKDFAATWNSTAHNLAEWDALRLFITFSQYLPTNPGEKTDESTLSHPGDRFLHARLQGMSLGSFDVYYDSTATEQIAVAQQKNVAGIPYYNVWTSFSTNSKSVAAAKSEDYQDELAIRSYRIQADIKPPTTVQARASLQVEILRGGSRSVLFELSRYLKVDEVKMDGRALELIQNQALEGTQLARRGNDILAVVFPQPLRAGQKFELSFNYSGDVLSEAGGGLLYVGARGTWYPNRGLASADFDLQFRYPAGWTLLATGKRTTPVEIEKESPNASPQEQTSRWVTDRPIPVAGFNLGRYEKATAQAEGVMVETYASAGVERNFPKQTEEVVMPPAPAVVPGRRQTVMVTQPPPSPARNAQVVADSAARAVNFYSQRFDSFPYDKLELTQMPGPLSQGWPGLIFLSSFAFLTKEERAGMHLDAADAILSQQITAHETAHQWWGDLVFWRGYRDQWIFEGLANYCSLMLLESENPTAFKIAMQKYREGLLQKNKDGAVLKDAGPVSLGVRLSSSEFPDGYEAISYGRGTWLFHMLRDMLNNAEPGSKQAVGQPDSEPFILALRRLRERYAGRALTTREMLQVFAEDLPRSLRYEGRKSLDWFYESWVNGTAVPHIELQGVKLTAKGNSLSVSGTVLQKNAPKDLVTSVPLYGVLSANRRIFLGRVFADGPDNSFRITAPGGVKRIVADPDGTVLSSPR